MLLSFVGNNTKQTKYTEINDVYITGLDNMIILCRGIHTPTISDYGIKNVIAYIDC